MPSHEEIARIIEEMRSQGLSESEIVETLQDMGVPADIIRSVLGGNTRQGQPAGNTSAHESEGGASISAKDMPEEQTASIQQGNDDLFAQSPAPAKDVLSELMSTGNSATVLPSSGESETNKDVDTAPAPPAADAGFSAGITTPPILEEESVPAEKLDEIHSKVDALHKAIASSDKLRDDVAEIKEMLRELKKELYDVRSMFSAIQHLLQQILETDRSILVDLYEKSKK